MTKLILATIVLVILGGGYFMWQGQPPVMPNSSGQPVTMQPQVQVTLVPTPTVLTQVDPPPMAKNGDGTDSPNRFDLGNLNNPGGHSGAQGAAQAYPAPPTPTLIVVETIWPPVPPPATVLPPSPPLPPAGQPQLFGRVYQNREGQAVPVAAGVEIRLLRSGGSFVAHTNQAGWFGFTNLTPGYYQLFVGNRLVQAYNLELKPGEVAGIFITPQEAENYSGLRIDVLFDKLWMYENWRLNWSLRLWQIEGPGNPMISEIFGYFDPAKFTQGKNFTLRLWLPDDKRIRWASWVWTQGSYGEYAIKGGYSHPNPFCEPLAEFVSGHNFTFLEIDNIKYEIDFGCKDLK